MSKKPESKLTIRMPAELHEELVKGAQEASRSLNAEMVHRMLVAPQLSDKLRMLRREVEAATEAARQSRDASKRTGGSYYALERVVEYLERALEVAQEDDIATAEEIRGVARLLETLMRRVDEIDRRNKGQ